MKKFAQHKKKKKKLWKKCIHAPNAAGSIALFRSALSDEWLCDFLLKVSFFPLTSELNYHTPCGIQ